MAALLAGAPAEFAKWHAADRKRRAAVARGFGMPHEFFAPLPR